MIFRNYILLSLLMLVFAGCSGISEKKVSHQPVRLGKSATLDDLSAFKIRWEEEKAAVILYDSRLCVRDNLNLNTLTYFNIASLDSLLNSASGNKHNIDPEKVKRIFVASFSDPCGDSANIAWVFVDVEEGLKVVDHEQVME